MGDDIASLIERGDVDALQKLAAGDDKARAKAARRGLHVLRTRGVRVAEAAPPARAAVATAPANAPELPCLCSSYDARGERALWLARPLPSGIAIFEIYISELQGVTGYRGGESTRKGYRELTRELLGERRDFAVAEVPWAFARAEVEAAYQLNLRLGRAAPPQFLRDRAQLGKAEPPATHPALALWPEAPAVAPADTARLHDLPECRGWIPERGEMERTAMKLEEVAQSRLVVSPQQKRAAGVDVLARAVREAFADGERRARMRKRLLDTAFLTHQVGSREADAACARAAADHFLPDAAVEDSPFAQRLYEKCFRLPGEPEVETAPAPARPGGLIIPP
jgi:hypothetical protein